MPKITALQFQIPYKNGLFSIVLFWFLISSLAASVSYAADKNSINDPAYGEVLFHLFESNYFEALSRALIANESPGVPGRESDIEFLIPKLYLDYGMLTQGRASLQQLPTTKDTAVDIQRNWLNLARAFHQRGKSKEAAQILQQLNKALPDELEDERNALHGLLFLEAGQYQQAVDAFKRVKSNSDWAAYSRYNQGIALLRVGQLDEGVQELNKLGRRDFATEELKSLKDQANLALGYLFLQAKEPLEAIPFLERVRLSGLHSAKALLGIGWANLMLEEYEKALIPWMEILKREPGERAVLEAYLAVPYSFAQAKAAKQALDHYDRAIVVLNKELDGVNTAISSIKTSGISDKLFKAGAGDLTSVLNKSTEGRIHRKLLRNPMFGVALRNYRDLKKLYESINQSSIETNVYKSTFAARAAKAKNNQQQSSGGLQGTMNENFQRDIEHKRRAEKLNIHIQQLKEKLITALQNHEQFFSQAYLAELEQEKEMLNSYLAQARFAMAQLYDRVLNEGALK